MNLVEILRNQTESLKNQYIAITAEWAANEFVTLRKWAKDYENGKFGYGVASKKYYRLPSYIVNSNGTAEQHISAMVKNAEAHYDQSIEKLAFRIAEKGLNQELLKFSTSHIGVNIETTLTDGIKTVRAFTIIASGEIQKPHYRYLVK